MAAEAQKVRSVYETAPNACPIDLEAKTAVTLAATAGPSQLSPHDASQYALQDGGLPSIRILADESMLDSRYLIDVTDLRAPSGSDFVSDWPKELSPIRATPSRTLTRHEVELTPALMAHVVGPLSANPLVKLIQAEIDEDGCNLYVYVDTRDPAQLAPVADLLADGYDAILREFPDLPIDQHIWRWHGSVSGPGDADLITLHLR